MGTVPDPLRSAKLSLVTACKEENSLRELQSPEHQHKQASIERNSNGYPFPAKGQPSGEHFFEVKYAAEANIPRGERHCGYDTHQPTMFSPGSLSLSKEGCRAALEPVDHSEQEASHGDKGQAPAEGCTSVQAVAKVPASQEADQNVHSGAGGQLCSGVDQASSPSGDVTEDKAHNPPSSAHLNAQQVAPAAKEIVDEMVGFEKTQALPSAKELESVSDLGVKAPACSDAELKVTKDTSSQPSARSGSEVESKTNLESPPQPSCNDETAEKAVPQPSKFKDTGTMTGPPEDGSADGEARNRARRDAEVQAVASVESKSASTSPSILTAFLRESMPSEAKQKQEQLHIIYTGAGGKEQSEIVDNLAALVQTVPSILPEVRIQAPAAVEGWLGAQGVRRQDDLAGTGDAIHSALVDNAQHPCPPASGSPQETAVQRTEVQRADMAGSHSDVPVDSSILLKTRPVYQITVNPSNQSVAPSHPVNIETKLPPSSTLPEINSKQQHLGSSAIQNQQAAPSCHRVSEKTDTVTTMAGVHSSNQGEQLPTKTVSDFEIGPDRSHVDVKPKREGQLIHLDPKEQEASNTRAAAGPQTMCAPVTAQRALNAFPGDKKEATAAGSRNLAIGLEAEPSRNSVPGLGTQNNETRKGPKLDHASAKPVPNLGGKKKDLKSATETKVQLKQSKHVRDVVWDEQGMTWEVYGASLDPESLGIAIQNHLQRQIREHEKLIKAQSTQTRKSISSDTSSNKKLKGRHQNVFQSMLQNFRRPNCCVRPAASAVLD
ncbi:G protein-regulated inducer of neurite outgrowth 3 [Elgaria multicarinata webbii]|uniref:G protein-regulated inducer of neurite outgrowth 3 n=1 Tax=Elgaria multicarinata webbii TaxID=159646 RepID=UPI002FCCD8D1